MSRSLPKPVFGSGWGAPCWESCVPSTMGLPATLEVMLPGLGWSLGSSGTARQDEETSVRGSAQGQTLSPQGSQPSGCLCNTLKARTGPRRGSADQSWGSGGCIQPAASPRGQASILAWHSTREEGGSEAPAPLSLWPQTRHTALPQAAACSELHAVSQEKWSLYVLSLAPSPEKLGGCPQSRQDRDCFGGSRVSGSTCPAPGPSTMAAFLQSGQLSSAAN